MATVTGTLSATRLKSTQATGVAPLTVASTTAVTNLNADLLDGNHAAAFAAATHVHAAADITTGTMADARIAASNVTQHQAALSVATGQITGTLPTTKGGTGLTSYTTGDVIYASAADTLSKLAAGTNGHVLTLAAGVPSWAAPTGGVSNAFSSVVNSAGVSQFTASGSAALKVSPGADIGVTFDPVDNEIIIAYTGSSSGILRGYADITADSGTIAASGADTVSIVGAAGITTAATSAPDTLTITLGNHSAALLTSGTLDSARLPTVPTTKGGTGITTLGTAGQALVVNSGATGYEHADLPTSDGWVLADREVLGSPAASVTLTIPSGYTELEITCRGRGTTAATNTDLYVTFNGVGGTSYSFVYAGSAASEAVGTSVIRAGYVPASTAPSGYFGMMRGLIGEYTSTAMNKVMEYTSGLKYGSGAGTQAWYGGAGTYHDTSTAITSVTFVPAAGNFDTGSVFTARVRN